MAETVEELNFRKLTGVAMNASPEAKERQRASLEAGLRNPNLSMAARARSEQGLAALAAGYAPRDIGVVNQRTGQLMFSNGASSSGGLVATAAGGLADLRSQLAGIPNPVLYGAAGAAGLAIGAGALVLSRRGKRKSSGKSKRKAGKSKSRRKGSRRPLKGGVSRTRGKLDRNRRGGAVRDRYRGRKVYRTKKGQPYILKANGQARFVKA